jgi:hypothetical protein
MKNLKAMIELHPTRETPRRIFDIDFKPDLEKPEPAPTQLLSELAKDLKIDTPYSVLKAEPVKTSSLGSHVLYQQQFRNIPVTGAWIRMDVDQKGNIYQVFNELVPKEQLEEAEQMAKAHDLAVTNGAEHLYSSEEITEGMALTALGATADRPVAYFLKEKVYFQVNEIPVLAWKIIIALEEPAAEWKLYLDAYTGIVLDKYIISKYLNGAALVFDPNPVAVLNDTALTNRSLIPDSAYTAVSLLGLDSSGTLSGDYVNTRTTADRVNQPDMTFNFKRGIKGFNEVMAYFHIDRAQRYIQSLGIPDILSSKSIAVNVSGGPVNFAYYSQIRKDITFGTASIDCAEDAEIILHEYGHAIQDFQVNGFGSSPEAAAMGEGFGDYFAASFFSDKKPALMKPTFANWKSVTFSGAEPPCLRRLDSNKLYRDLAGSPYNDGEIWSACLWEIRAAIGRMNADKIILLHHSYLTPWATFVDGANAIITTDKKINDGKNIALLNNIFIRRGILPNPERANMLAGAQLEIV